VISGESLQDANQGKKKRTAEEKGKDSRRKGRLHLKSKINPGTFLTQITCMQDEEGKRGK